MCNNTATYALVILELLQPVLSFEILSKLCIFTNFVTFSMQHFGNILRLLQYIALIVVFVITNPLCYLLHMKSNGYL